MKNLTLNLKATTFLMSLLLLFAPFSFAEKVVDQKEINLTGYIEIDYDENDKPKEIFLVTSEKGATQRLSLDLNPKAQELSKMEYEDVMVSGTLSKKPEGTKLTIKTYKKVDNKVDL